jgi:mannitol/fructose-specific phosphotransferase system IIA component (Ntr-type)
MKEISPYIQEKDREIVRKKIEDCLFHNSNLSMPASYKPEKAGLLDLLKGDRVRILSDADSWIKALWQAGEPLLKAGSIEERYIDTIISQLQYYGPYMFITPGVILAHAKPEDGVLQLDAAMTIYRKPVVFSDFHKASIIIILAASDQESHLKILRDIAELFSKSRTTTSSGGLSWALIRADYLHTL